MRDQNRYLLRRDERWHYVRRVPSDIAHLDPRIRIRIKLETPNIEIARMRRDDMETADDLYWAALSAGSGADAADTRYKAAQARAKALGVTYKTADELNALNDLGEIARRVALLEKTAIPQRYEVEALLGGVAKPVVAVSRALEIYIDDIAPIELKGKSEKQIRSWKKIPARAVNNFIAVAGDKPMEDITREDAVKYYDWWQARVVGTPAGRKATKPVSGNSANRDIGNMRKIYRLYFKRLGEETRLNPFRDLVFPDRKIEQKPILPFETDWLERRILAPGVLEKLNRQARLIVLAMIETGCRPSEICNLNRSRIHLGAEIPYIQIDYAADRAIKTDSSVRDIPLLGVSLSALRLAPDGFSKYRDKEDTLSATLMKHFRRFDLLPSDNHRIYSIRHSFEKRMLEKGLDYGLRCKLMGHVISRPEYGDGGSMAYRRDELKKITFDVPGWVIRMAG